MINAKINRILTTVGVDEANDSTVSIEEALADHKRIDFYYRHLSFVRQAFV